MQKLIPYSIFILLLLHISCKAGVDARLVSERIRLAIQPDTLKLFMDPLGNTYLINSQNTIKQYNKAGHLLYTYSNDRLGIIQYLEVKNPLKILVFYAEFQLVIALDNTLSETGRYDFHSLQLEDIPTMGLSNDNNLWVYDPINFSLKKIDFKGKVIQESNSLVSENLSSLNPERIFEFRNKVYVYDNTLGMHVFDNFGQYLYAIPEIRNSKKFVLQVDESIIYLTNDGLFRKLPHAIYAPEKLSAEDWPEEILDFEIFNNYWYFLTKQGLIIRSMR